MKNKLTTTFTIMKIIILALTLLAFAYFMYLGISAKINYANSNGENFVGIGVALAFVIVLAYGLIVDGVLSVFSLIWLIVASVSKNKVIKNVDGALTEEEQKVLVARRKKDVLHFILLTLLPMVTWVISVIVCRV